MADLVDRVKFVRGSVLHPTELIDVCQRMDVERIVHLPSIMTAASRRSPLTAYELNVGGVLNVLEAASILDIERVVCASSVAVYSSDAPPLQREDDPTVPSTVYGMTKLAVEHSGAFYARDRGLRFIALRPTRLYGPGRRRGELEKMTISALRGEDFCWLGGSAIELLYVADEARAFALATLADLPLCRVFNVCSSRKHSAREIIEALRKALPDVALEPTEPLPPAPAVEALQPRLDSRRAAEELGWKPHYSLVEGVGQLVAWLRREEGM
jgi:UDP-glucose 4-epimerase